MNPGRWDLNVSTDPRDVIARQLEILAMAAQFDAEWHREGPDPVCPITRAAVVALGLADRYGYGR